MALFAPAFITLSALRAFTSLQEVELAKASNVTLFTTNSRWQEKTIRAELEWCQQALRVAYSKDTFYAEALGLIERYYGSYPDSWELAFQRDELTKRRDIALDEQKALSERISLLEELLR